MSYILRTTTMEIFSAIYTKGEITYLSLITLLLSLLWVLGNRIINRTENSLRLKAKKIEDYETIHTESPVENLEQQSREIAEESVVKRFSLVRGIFNSTLLIIWLAAVFIPSLEKVPANLASFVLGSLTILVGIAAKPFVENIIAGIVLSFSQPFRIGDTVNIDEHWGTIEKIERTFTVVRIWDWRRYIIPNAKLISKEFVNYTTVDSYQWASVEFWVPYEADLEKIEELVAKATRKSKYFVEHEKPRFWIMEMTKDSIRCWAAGWADSPADAWALAHDLRTHLITDFRAHNIRCDIHHHQFQPNQFSHDHSPNSTMARPETLP
ncbi:MAG: mechanosensitive ion channel domain-containing protein [Myxococcota bacterium]|nr:mechanosensitive ion channel domain-containing protein [Myxococcota bacterium]